MIKALRGIGYPVCLDHTWLAWNTHRECQCGSQQPLQHCLRQIRRHGRMHLKSLHSGGLLMLWFLRRTCDAISAQHLAADFVDMTIMTYPLVVG